MPCDFIFIQNDTAGAIITPGGGTGTPPPPQLMVRYYVPNALGWVIVREGDSHYIRVTLNFATKEFVYDDLGASAPSAGSYDILSQDAEWTNPFDGPGWYDSVNKPILLFLGDGAGIPALAGGVTATKGVCFAPGYGPILLCNDLERMKLGIDAQTQITKTPV